MEPIVRQMNANQIRDYSKMEHVNNALSTKSLVLTKDNVFNLNVALEKLYIKMAVAISAKIIQDQVKVESDA